MISPLLILFSSFFYHVAIAGRTCPKPDDLPFAIVSPLKTSYEPGDQIVYTCQPGYVSHGNMRRFTCPFTGLWPINTLRCRPMTCPLPPTPKFAELSAYKSLAGNRTLYGNRAVFKCLPHYAMFGNDTVTCTASGNWTELPECKDNGFVNYAAKEALYYKDKATFGCHDTFVLDGPEEVECTKYGNWSAQPSCKASCKISVKKATVIYEGERVKIQEKFKNGMLHGQKVSFFCKNKEKKCSYTEDAQCIDGTFEIPKCFKERQRCALWIRKLCEPSGTGVGIMGRKNRNLYAKLLLHMLKRGVIEGPFIHRPEPGTLKTLPSYMSIYFDEPNPAQAKASSPERLPDWVMGELGSSKHSESWKLSSGDECCLVQSPADVHSREQYTAKLQTRSHSVSPAYREDGQDITPKHCGINLKKSALSLDDSDIEARLNSWNLGVKKVFVLCMYIDVAETLYLENI
ncbi:Beta-2-glycoprotein 1 [Pteropus alecto]|uniref:Beta-2-glycoprotein 1 n=1 Tax=Pteropus alecto TaxID=9402 RepID=L5KNI7_PTEAL|nr:Beta-2-glycoprotein 1 [Pteropus alecto]